MKNYLLVLGFCIVLVGINLALSLFISVGSQINQDLDRSATPMSVAQVMPLQVDPNIPKQIYPCLAPKADQESLREKGEEIKKITMLGKATEGKQTYYYLSIDTIENSESGTTPDSYQPLIRLDANKKCVSLYPEEEYGPLSYYIPMPVARELALQSLKKEIENSGSKQKYEQELNEDSQHAGMRIVLSHEEVWAHELLKIRIPSGYKILSKPVNRSGPRDY